MPTMVRTSRGACVGPSTRFLGYRRSGHLADVDNPEGRHFVGGAVLLYSTVQRKGSRTGLVTTGRRVRHYSDKGRNIGSVPDLRPPSFFLFFWGTCRVGKTQYRKMVVGVADCLFAFRHRMEGPERAGPLFEGAPPRSLQVPVDASLARRQPVSHQWDPPSSTRARGGERANERRPRTTRRTRRDDLPARRRRTRCVRRARARGGEGEKGGKGEGGRARERTRTVEHRRERTRRRAARPPSRRRGAAPASDVGGRRHVECHMSTSPWSQGDLGTHRDVEC